MTAKRSKKRVTIHDVARAAGVTIATVSRAINGGRASDEMRQHVLSVVAQLGYRVDAVAQSMRRQTTKAVAILAHDTSNPLFASVMNAAQGVLEKSGYILILAGSGSTVEDEAHVVQQLGQRRVDAIIAFLKHEVGEELKDALLSFPGPLVLFDREIAVPADRILTDNAGGASCLARRLLEFGHRHIALVGGTPGVLPVRERVRGITQAFRDFGLPPPFPQFLRTDSVTAAYGFHETTRLLNGKPRPTAIIAGNNQTLEGILEAVYAADLCIPKDISVAGFDDSPTARAHRPRITVVTRDVVQMGVVAANLVLQRLQGVLLDDPQEVVLPTNLVERESCGPPPLLCQPTQESNC